MKATLAVFLAVSLFVSCSSKSVSSSFISYLDEIDGYITAGSTEDAMESLEKLEKKAVTPFQRLGIYKRYSQLGEVKKSEQVLQKAMKKLPDNKDITAVYVHFLLEQGRTLEAFDLSRKLEDTEYASLYAESLIRFTKENRLSADEVFNFNFKNKKIHRTKKNTPSDKEINMVFHDSRFIPLFKYCWKVTKDHKWLVNGAAVLMQQGDFAGAASLMPENVSDLKESYFWACVLYDSGRYAEALDLLKNAEKYWNGNTYSVMEMALAADCWYILDEESKAEDLRTRIIALDSNQLTEKEQENLLSIIYLDSALYLKNEGNVAEQYYRLHSLVNLFPYYEPGLAAYGQFALETLRRPPEDELLQAIRKAGLKTQGMEKKDSLPAVALEDALERIEKALKIRRTPELVVLKEEMFEETHELSRGEKTGRMWKLLENNEEETGFYPSQLVRFAIITMINSKSEDEAFQLYELYLKAVHGIKAEDIYEFREQRELSLWEYEAAAWFLKDRDINKALELYSWISSRYGQRSPGNASLGQNDSVVSAMMNEAVIYGGRSKYSTAYDILNTASGRTRKSEVKAEILYRMAELEVLQGNKKGAIRSLKYAISLNENHNKARLLLKTITEEK